jgi:DNA-binding beta-propeller fold protein YncE
MHRLHGLYHLLAASLCVVCVAGTNAAEKSTAKSAAEGLRVVKVWHVGGEGRWDLLAVDAAAKRLYVPRSTHMQVISTETGQVVGDLKDTPGIHGVAVVPDAGRGFTSNGKDGTVTVFELKTLKVVGMAKAGQNPDAILYDPASKKVLCFNGRSNDATVIDPKADPAKAVVATIALGGKPELAVSDGKHHVYVNLEDKSAVAVIDMKTMKLAETWKIEGGEEPSGLAIDTKHHRLFAGCGGNNVMAILDAKTGKTLMTLPIGKGVDGCGFDPRTGEAFASCGGDGVLTVVKEVSPDKFEVVRPVQTRQGAKTLALNPTTHEIYLPTAEFQEAAAGARPAMKPDTFMIVVVSSKTE